MNLDWQNLIVLAIVAGAAAYIARLGWASFVARKASACGGCRNCAADKNPRDVFSIEAHQPAATVDRH